MNLRIFNDYSALSRATTDLITTFLKAKPKSLVCLASGHSPKGVFDCLIDDVKNNRVDISQCTFISLDEWIGIPAAQKGSCRAMMDEDLFGPLSIGEKQIIFFDGMAKDPAKEVRKVNKAVSKHGGMDIMLVGIGTNGHIAMNEPGTSFDLEAHVSTLAEETKVVGQKYFKENTVLNQGITLGLKQFREARLPILMANGPKKAAIIQLLLSSESNENLPASIIHSIPGGYTMLDRDAYG